jgi:hypothetical protein
VRLLNLFYLPRMDFACCYLCQQRAVLKRGAGAAAPLVWYLEPAQNYPATLFFASARQLAIPTVRNCLTLMRLSSLANMAGSLSLPAT